ncbi:hypothetical protein NTGBS_520034 [Candidatus Nitrotoga sp. BS]|nr:hypothetical protein NTGBS_520034 [Candidatus Nitrotoga sp. BS]
MMECPMHVTLATLLMGMILYQFKGLQLYR